MTSRRLIRIIRPGRLCHRQRRRDHQFLLLDLFFVGDQERLLHLLLVRRFRSRGNLLAVLFQMVLQSKRPTVRSAADIAAELQIVVLLVGGDVGASCIKRGERSRALGAPERFGVRVLVARELHSSFKCFRTEGTGVGALVAVCQQVVVVNRRCFESFSAVFARVGTNSGVSPHVQSQTVGHSESFSTYLKQSKI